MNTITQIKNTMALAAVIVKTTKWRVLAGIYLALFLTLFSPTLAVLVWLAGGLLDLITASYISERYNISVQEIQQHTALSNY